MRLRVFFFAVFLALLSGSFALADTVTYGDITYVFPAAGEAGDIPALTVITQGLAYDEATLSPVTEAALPGAVFGVYAKDSAGGYVPYANPSDPTGPLTFLSGHQPVTLYLPASIDLYLKQESAPEGYSPDPDMPEYQPISLPDTLTYTNRREGMQGLWVSVVGNDSGEGTPLAGIRLTLSGGGNVYTLTTDGEGNASMPGLSAGDYTLRQDTKADGYSIASSEISITINPNEPVMLTVENHRDGTLALRALGISADEARVARLIPIDRAFDVFNAQGNYVGRLSGQDTLQLPASADGTAYTLKVSTSQAADGFADDPTEYTAVLFPGQTTLCQTAVRSEKGFFTFTHVSSDTGLPIPGGSFALYGADGTLALSFDADDRGRYESSAPLAPGQYTLRMTHAADGHLYSDASASVDIKPFLSDGYPIATAAFSSETVPASMQEVDATATLAQLPSLFDEAAEFTFRISMPEDGLPLPIVQASYTYELPNIEGMEVVERTDNGATLRLAQRFAMDGVPEIKDITFTGVAHYTYAYQIDAVGTLQYVSAARPFTVTVAEFAAPKHASYAASGYIYDEESKLISGMQVSWGDETITSDLHGAYAFGLKQPGEIVFHVEDGMGVRMEGSDAYILPLRTVSGQVVTHGGLEGYPLTLSIGDITDIALDASGRFSVTGILGTHDLLSVEAEAGVLTQVAQDGDSWTVHLYAPASISGQAQTPEATAVDGVQVALRGNSTSLTAKTDSAGAFTFDGLLPGSYTLAFEAPDGYILYSSPSATVSIDAGEENAGTLINAMKPAAISGTLYDGDAPYAGIAVTLNPGALETLTGEDGGFSFTDLTLGEYEVTFSIADNAVLLDAPAPITISQSAQRESILVHTVRPAQMAGRVWYDDNDDGYLSNDESGQKNALLTLFDQQGNEIAQFTTDDNGEFAFTDLVPGTYRIQVTLPEGMIFARQVSDAQRLVMGAEGREDISGWYTLTSGQQLSGLVCGAVTAGSISGVVWEDANGNGILDNGEAVQSGITVVLMRGDTILGQSLTGQNGRYDFENLRAGDYSVRFTLPEGTMFTQQAGSSTESVTSTVAQSDANETQFSLSLRRFRMQETVHAGMLRVGSVSAHVWFDANATGVYTNQTGREGVTVALYAVKGSHASPAAQAETDAQGNVAFTGLRPGEYQLRYQLPADTGWGFTAGTQGQEGLWGTSDTFTVGNGEAVEAVKIGLTQLGGIEGMLFMDANYNGTRDIDESGLMGTVTLLDGTGKTLQESLISSDGRYAFDGLVTGMYVVRFTLPEGHSFTRERKDAPSFNSDVPETAAGTSQTSLLYLPIGETLLVDAGAYRPASITGSVWQDMANDGIWHDGNPGVSGAEVALLADGAVYATTTTDASGGYSFATLPPGEYSLRVTIGGGMRFSKQPVASIGRYSHMPDTEKTTSETSALTLQNGESRSDLDFGVVQTGAVSGLVKNLKTGQGLAGTSITLQQDGNIIAQTITAANGLYSLEGLRPGTATVRFAAPDGFALDASLDNPVTVTIAQGGLPAAANMDCLPEATLDGVLWLDANGDGEFDGNAEAGLLGVSVSLYQIVDGESTLVATNLTTSDGRFRFEKLLPGQYQLTHIPAPGIVFYNSNESAVFTLNMGDQSQYKASAYIGSTISGSVWEDLNNDSLHTFNEPAIAEATVTLIRPSGATIMETTTDGSGNYRFTNVPPGECAVRFILPETFIFADPVEGGSVVPRTDSYIGVSRVYMLEMGTELSNINAGALRHTRIGDLVWLDENLNGLQDTGEPGVPGVIIKLWYLPPAGGDMELVAETTSDGNGFYRFDSVRPGSYRMSFDFGAGFAPTLKLDTLDQINSKLPWTSGTSLMTEPFVAESGRHQLTIDAGLVPRDTANSLGWFK